MNSGKFGIQVIALGDAKFRAVFYPGGLPGDGWTKDKPKVKTDGAREDDAVTFAGGRLNGTIKNGSFAVTDSGNKALGTLKKVERESPTLGAKPPQGAIILFDGKSADAGVSANQGLAILGLVFVELAGVSDAGNHFFYVIWARRRGIIDSINLFSRKRRRNGFLAVPRRLAPISPFLDDRADLQQAGFIIGLMKIDGTTDSRVHGRSAQLLG